MRDDLGQHLKTVQELTDVKKECLDNIKDIFEHPPEGYKRQREQIDIKRSEADKRRVMRTFAQVSYIQLILNIFSVVYCCKYWRAISKYFMFCAFRWYCIFKKSFP